MNPYETQLLRHPLHVQAQLFKGASLISLLLSGVALGAVLSADVIGAATWLFLSGIGAWGLMSLHMVRLEGRARAAVVAEIRNSLSEIAEPVLVMRQVQKRHAQNRRSAEFADGSPLDVAAIELRDAIDACVEAAAEGWPSPTESVERARQAAGVVTTFIAATEHTAAAPSGRG